MKRWISLFAIAALATTAAFSQDLNSRRGFSVKVVEPEAGGIVSGATRVRVEVEAPRIEDVAKIEFFIDDELVFVDTEPPWQVVHDFGSGAAVKVIRVVAHHEDGPTVSDFAITRSLDAKYIVNVQRVLMDVSVRDRDRLLVTGLGQLDFRVLEDGAEQEILSVAREERPLLVGILIDSSGSMHGERISTAREAACKFVQTLREEDRAFVIDFDEAVYMIQKTTNDRDELCAAIQSAEAVGGTALFDAINAAYRSVHRAPGERRALVILSDGDDTSSNVEFEQVLDSARLSDVTVYAIGLDVGTISTAHSQLNKLTKETGGRAFFIKKAAQLSGTYEAIAEELRSLYLITYSSNNEEFDGRFIEIDVEVPGKRYDIRHRSGYYAISP